MVHSDHQYFRDGWTGIFTSAVATLSYNVSRATPQHTGVYTCIAWNNIGISNRTFVVNVTGNGLSSEATTAFLFYRVMVSISDAGRIQPLRRCSWGKSCAFVVA